MSVVVPKRGVFPMHMTPFESYMFVDDSVKYPMTFIVEFEFSGRVDRAAFQDSINQALIRHSLLRSFIQPAKQNRDCWVAPESYDSRVIWLGLDEAIEVEGASEFINLREEIGVRCWCQHDEATAPHYRRRACPFAESTLGGRCARGTPEWSLCASIRVGR